MTLSVNAKELAGGVSKVAPTFGHCQTATTTVVDSLGGMISAVGHPGLSSAGLSADWIRVSFETAKEAGDAPLLLEIYWTSEGQQLHGERFSVREHQGGFVLTHTQGIATLFADRPITRRDLAAYISPRLRAAR